MSQVNVQELETRYRDGKPLCNAKKNTCGAFRMRGKMKCYNHGGATPIGPAHGAYKHGSLSKYIPSRLAQKYNEALNDGDLMGFRRDCAFLQSRLCELLETGESQPLWASAQEAYGKLRAAMADNDGSGITYWLSALDGLINRGMADSLRWREVYGVVEQIGKTKERESKMLVQQQQMMTTEQVLAMIGQIALDVRRHFTNSDEIRAFAATLNRYGVVETGQLTDAGH